MNSLFDSRVGKFLSRFLFAAITCIEPATVRAQPYAFTTLAGLASANGSADGGPGIAQFSGPVGAAVDGAGNVFVTDGNTVRKITPSGMVTTFAGLPPPQHAAFIDGSAVNARFSRPSGIAVDGAGNLYVADSGNVAIRKITPAGVVSTVAISGVALNGPLDVAVDGAGNVFVADYISIGQNYVYSAIVKITPDGVGSTLVAMTNSDAFRAVAVDGMGNVFVIQTLTIRRITPAGVMTIIAGQPGITSASSGSVDGPGDIARFNNPGSLALDSAGNIYVTDEYTIRTITPAGIVATLAGQAGKSGNADGTGPDARFQDARDVAIDRAGNLYVTDVSNHTVRKVTAAGVVTTWAGQAMPYASVDGFGPAARFGLPTGIARDGAANLYVTDHFNGAVRRITAAGLASTVAVGFVTPDGIAIDVSGNLYVTDSGDNTVRKITPAGIASILAGQAGNSGSTDGTGVNALFNKPFGTAVDGAGNLLIADSGNHTIRKISPAGAVSTLAGSAGVGGFVDGPSAMARFQSPHGVAVDSVGNVYVADTGNRAVRKINPAGAVVTIASYADATIPPGLGIATPLPPIYAPVAIAVDGAGNCYLTDSNAVTKVTPDGVVIRLGGSLSFAPGTYSDGTGGNASFFAPRGVAADNAGTVYVADTSNHVVRVGTPAPTTARLANVSVRSIAGANANVLIVGFVVNGTGAEQVLVRAVGPGLSQFGVVGVLANPLLALFDSNGNQLATNAGWGGSTILASEFSQVGAFTLQANSADSALAQSLTFGSYTAQISGPNSSSGVALAEIYEAKLSPTTAYLVNLSGRAVVGPGANVLIAGFVVNGTGTEQVLVRAVGPGLSQFGVAGVLANPQLALFDSNGNQLAANAGWGGSTILASEFNQVGAFALSNSSADSVITVRLPPGAYTAQVSGVAGTHGVALIEVYELP